MRVLLINPNTSVEMTDGIAAEARRHVDARVEIVPVTASFGCAVIASRAAYVVAAHAGLELYEEHGAGADAIVLACFGDPGLEALREVAAAPVIGLLDSAMAAAATDGRPFAIVTAGPAWVPMLEERVRLSPQAAALRGVFAIAANGLAVSRDPAGATAALQGAVDAAQAAGAQAVVLGGSALAGFGSRLASAVELIDPLAVAMRVAVSRGATPTNDTLRYRERWPDGAR
jgi:Asp/Glu/hydantoin racemase